MPPRIARSSVGTAPKSAKKGPGKSKNRGSTKRSLNAFAIAAEQNLDKSKVRRSRLGEVEDDGPRHKRRRVEEDDDGAGDSEEDTSARRSRRPKDALDVSEGSDSEGNTWRYGEVNDDDDSDIDSDEAFGSSDEERFAGFVFRGSSTTKANGKSKAKAKAKASSSKDRDDSDGEEDIDLEEQAEVDEEDDEESLGEDAVDLATMLDDVPSDEDDDIGSRSGSEDNSSEDEDADNRGSDYSMSDEDEDDKAERATQLKDLVSALHPADRKGQKERRVDTHEAREASTSGLVASEKFDIMDILANTADPTLKQAAKQTGTLPQALRGKKDLKLQPAPPKRQKDKLDRKAATEKAVETLNRWVDTVKHNREAEHLVFPLQDPEAEARIGEARLLSTSNKPMTDLEGAIQGILKESGLIQNGMSVEERELAAYEELQARQLPLEEVEARREQLRRNRDLLFREEVRARRVKKIKSKAYRRVHRKEREKLAALDRDAFADGTEDMDPEEKEEHDRRRAEERMGAKHRNSKWAKQMKKSGRSVWDDEAKGGVTEMARRNEELRRRIEGKEVVSGDEEDADSESSEPEGEFSDDDDQIDSERVGLERGLDKLSAPSVGSNKLSNLAFMERAEARRRAENDEEIRKMRRDLNGEQSSSESEEVENIGRKIFGPLIGRKEEPEMTVERGEFEEQSDNEEEYDAALEGTAPLQNAGKTSNKGIKTSQRPEVVLDPTIKARSSTAAKAPASVKTNKNPASKSSNLSNGIEMHRGEKHSQPDVDGWQTVTYSKTADNDSEASDSDNNEPAMTDADIIRNAFFAGDEVEAAFEAEKDELIVDEDDKIIDNTLPGWGSWAGENLSKREQRKNKNRFLTVEKGIAPKDRKDAKLKHVIINQKRQRGTTGFMATSLPFPFTNRQEYERAMRMPLGKEWNVKEVFQGNTKPRVLVKPNAIIKPMEKPLM